jgi:hypothetical protein
VIESARERVVERAHDAESVVSIRHCECRALHADVDNFELVRVGERDDEAAVPDREWRCIACLRDAEVD